MRANRSTYIVQVIAVILAAAAWSGSAAADSSGMQINLIPRAQGWLAKSHVEHDLAASPAKLQEEMRALKAIAAKRTATDVARFQWWSTGGPVYRWNEMILDEMQENFSTLPIAARHLALFHATLDDAVASALAKKGDGAHSEPAGLDTALKATRKDIVPSEYAAAAAAGAEVLGYLFPARAAHFAAKAQEAIYVRQMGGAELPSDAAAGQAIGKKAAALAIARGKSDNSDAKWTGTVPEGAGMWKGTNPIAPLAGTWQPWVLSSASEFRPAPPPAFDSDQVKAALAELKAFQRTPKSNHRAVYWEVHGGARAHHLWNEIARAKLLEHNTSATASARILAAVNIALADAGVACWDAKYAFWYIRPPQLDPELKTVFPPPNHPSFPAAHGCFSTAAAVVLAKAFPQDRDRILAFGKEAAEARVWAGIHYRFDVDAGQELGRKVAERTLERSFVTRSN
jgi:hypothetical protein